MSIITIIIGLSIWLVLPILMEGAIKHERNRRAFSRFCMIVGIVVIACAVIDYFTHFFQGAI